MIEENVIEKIVCRGHPNVLSTHKTTIEITKETELSLEGDCIVGVAADKGMTELSEEFKSGLRSECEVEIVFECDGVSDIVKACGSPELILDYPKDMVIRKSNYVCGRTVAIGADKAAIDLKRELVEKLKEGLELSVTLSIR